MLSKYETRKILRDVGHSPREGECIGNALEAALCLFQLTEKTALIHNVSVPRLGPHAYLEFDGHMFSNKVTWPDNYYPELNRSKLLSLGYHCDITLIAALGVLTAMTSNSKFMGLLNLPPDKDIDMRYFSASPEQIQSVQDLVFSFAVVSAEQHNLPVISSQVREIYKKHTQ